jgi:hypothetical protein
MLRQNISRWIASVMVVGLMLHGGAAWADESYYMIVFGQEGSVTQLDHTFAAFVKATGNGPDKAKYTLDVHTLSWMPRSLDVKFLKRPEEGVNLDLKDSLRLARRAKAELSMWGPFRIQKELFERACRQEARLKNGAIDYKALDARFRPDSAMNCIHAVCDIDRDAGLLSTGTASGREASRLVANHLSRWIIASNESPDWIGVRLELGQDIIRRELQPKTAVLEK